MSNKNILHTRTIRALLFHPNGDFVFIAAPDTPRTNSNQQLTTCRLYLLKFNDVFADNLFYPPIDLNNLPSILSQIHLYSDGGIDISKDGNYILTCALLLTPPQSNFIVPSNNSIRNKPDSNNQSFRPIKPPNIANRLTPLTLSLNNTNLPDVHLDKSDELIELPPPIFSSTNNNVLIGYGVRNRLGVVSDHIEKYVACEVLDTSAELMTTSMILNDFEDEVNIAMFHPFPGYGIIYGTKKGKVKAFIR
eukprot:gene20055-26036_t